MCTVLVRTIFWYIIVFLVRRNPLRTLRVMDFDYLMRRNPLRTLRVMDFDYLVRRNPLRTYG